jgi:hypothetical protein
MQWFRGRFEGSYVGTPNGQPFLSPHGAGSHFQLRIYRAAVSDLTLTEPPAEAEPGAVAQLFRQPQLDDARVYGVRGPGTSYHGPIFDLRISELSFTHLTHKDGRSYGKVTGRAEAWLELPPEPLIELPIEPYADDEPEPQPELLAARRAAPEAERTRHVPPVVSKPGAARATTTEPLDPELDPLPSDAPETAPAAARVADSERPTALPLFALATAAALGLWASCGAEPALLWVVFMLPTLLCRKLFHGVLGDSQGIRGFGLFLVVVQLACVGVLLESWWSADCKQMLMLPLIGLVAVIFPAGLLPSVGPLLCNAAGLLLVLGVWCGGPSSKCNEAPERKPPSVQHPGVPRTNDDGSWPRRPPG